MGGVKGWVAKGSSRWLLRYCMGAGSGGQVGLCVRGKGPTPERYSSGEPQGRAGQGRHCIGSNRALQKCPVRF